MTGVNLNTPILSGGILNTNFFNGQVLGAEDLKAMQVANAGQHRQLGRAIGDGVAWGLNVTLVNSDPSQPVLHVTAGLALNRRGEAVALAGDIDLTLVKTSDPSDTGGGLFAECTPPQQIIPTNLDCYVLVASPASGLQGSAPMTTQASGGFASSCSGRYAVEGVTFSLIPAGVSVTGDATTLRGAAVQLYSQLQPLFLQLAGSTRSAQANLQGQIAPLLSLFRNTVAHLCFGTDALQSFPANPFPDANGDSPLDFYGLIDGLRQKGYVTDCGVPLALVYWTSAGIQFVDMWAVRRPVFPVPASQPWPLPSGERRMAEGLATLLQFQSHIAELPATLGTTLLGSVTATSYFRFLPALGFLPLGGVTGAVGVDRIQFFTGKTVRNPLFIEGSREQFLVTRSFAFSPIDLTNQEMIWLYFVRENVEPNPALSSAPPYLLFTNGQMRLEGQAYFDLNYWNYANYV